MVARIVKELPVVYRTRRFITVATAHLLVRMLNHMILVHTLPPFTYITIQTTYLCN
jgi:hypothetical protein